MTLELILNQKITLIAKSLGPASIRCRSDAVASDNYLIDIYLRAFTTTDSDHSFETWGVTMLNPHHRLKHQVFLNYKRYPKILHEDFISWRAKHCLSHCVLFFRPPRKIVLRQQNNEHALASKCFSAASMARIPSAKMMKNFIIFNSLKPRQNGRHLADDIFKLHFSMKMCECRLRFHGNLFIGFELTIFQHWLW